MMVPFSRFSITAAQRVRSARGGDHRRSAPTLLNSDFVSRQAGRLATNYRPSRRRTTPHSSTPFSTHLARDARRRKSFRLRLPQEADRKHEAVRHQLIFAQTSRLNWEWFPQSLPGKFQSRPPRLARLREMGGGYEGIKNVVPGRGPFVLMTSVAQADFTVSGGCSSAKTSSTPNTPCGPKGAETGATRFISTPQTTNCNPATRRETQTLAKRELRNHSAGAMSGLS